MPASEDLRPGSPSMSFLNARWPHATPWPTGLHSVSPGIKDARRGAEAAARGTGDGAGRLRTSAQRGGPGPRGAAGAGAERPRRESVVILGPVRVPSGAPNSAQAALFGDGPGGL